MLKYILFASLFFATIYSNKLNIGVSSNKSFTLPVFLDYSINSNMTIHHINRLYNINYPYYRYLHSSNSRNNITMISEVSYFSYINDNYSFKLGRDYIESDISSIAGLFFSNYSPSIDHVLFSFNKNNISARMIVASLNKEKIVCESQIDEFCYGLPFGNHYINRWLYYKHISYKFSDKLKFGFGDAIMSSGENRGVELYYLLPFGSFQAEQLHNISRQDFVETNENYGVDNDNGFMIFDISYLFEKGTSFYASLLIDDFQIDIEDRKHMQDVFGFLVGFSKSTDKITSRVEYGYASPWLYINSGLYTDYIHYSLPIGLRSPHSQSIDFLFNYNFDFGDISFLSHFEQRGIQSFNTSWNAWDNKISYFDFGDILEPELFIKYSSKNNSIPSLVFFSNWMQSKSKEVILEWKIVF